jgi:NAD(P)-dependent dehydrogenase (short-subunit alcohol dehydrogenase family)
MSTQKVALVTGANRGLGFEISRQLAQQGIKVLMGARIADQGETAAQSLRDEGLNVRAVKLDVTSTSDIDQHSQPIELEFGKLDVLINNAAVLIDMNVQPTGGFYSDRQPRDW